MWGLLAAVLLNGSSVGAGARCRHLDAEFRDHRVLVRYPVAGGTLTLLIDTGGGGSLLVREAAERIGLATAAPSPAIAAELGPAVAIASPPAVGSRSRPIPAPLLVVPSIFPVPGWPERLDGVLGQNWFAGGRWTVDYRRGELLLDCAARGRELPIGLPGRGAPAAAKQFPRVTVNVAGEPIPMLLDTGATTWLTDAALTAIGDGRPAVRATSMATSSRIANWRRQHPTWRVVEGAQRGTGARMIEVPDVVVAGVSVGPVWFTERPDENFTRTMSSMMSGPVEGAIGGNAFRRIRLTIDYPMRTAWVSRR